MLFSWNSASRNFATSPLPLVVHHESPHWKIPLKPLWYTQGNAKVDKLKMNILLLTKGNDQAKPTQSIQFSQIFCGGYLLRKNNRCCYCLRPTKHLPQKLQMLFIKRKAARCFPCKKRYAAWRSTINICFTDLSSAFLAFVLSTDIMAPFYFNWDSFDGPVHVAWFSM